MTVRLSITRDETDEHGVMFTSWWDNLFIYYGTTEGRCWTQVIADLEREWHARVIYQDHNKSMFGSSGSVEAIEFDRDEDATAFLLRWA